MVLYVEVGCFVGGDECKLVVVVGESASALGDRMFLCGSCLIRVTSMHCIKSVRMFEDDVTWPALVIQGGSLGGLGW